jgi:hypothetical protein
MSHLRNRLLITLILFAAMIVAPQGSASADPAVSTITVQENPSIRPVGRFAGEPDVGQTSPTNLVRAQSSQALKGDVRFDNALRLAVGIWKARYGWTGF